jgi:hypothetical protein
VWVHCIESLKLWVEVMEGMGGVGVLAGEALKEHS